MIRLENVSYQIGGSLILKDISVDIPQGKLTALIGANGAGKSTLLSLISRLLPLQRGKITCGGLDVSTATGDDIARVLSVLRQSNNISSRLTVRDLVSFGRYPYHKGRPTAADWEKVAQALHLFELTSLDTRFLDELSGGQRQRALVAMIYCQETDYILLDEPLNSLDLYHARKLMKLMSVLTKQQGRTVIVVLHDINYAAAHADNVIALRDGALIATGHPNEIIQSDTLKCIFGTEIIVREIDGKMVALHH